MCELMRRINAVERATGSSGVAHWGSSGNGNGEFDLPWDVAVYKDAAYVIDLGNDRVQVSDLDHLFQGTYQRQWGSSGNGNGEFDQPWSIAVYDDEVYVIDLANDRVQVFDLNGAYQRKWGSTGAGNGQFDKPEDIAVYGDEVYVTDVNNNRIQVFDLDGTYQRKWGTFGGGEGQFRYGLGIAIYDDEVYITELDSQAPPTNIMRVQVFNLTGTFQRQWTWEETGDIYTVDYHIDIYDGVSGARAYVADPYNSHVRVFTLTGTYLHKHADAYHDRGIAVYCGFLFTTDIDADRIWRRDIGYVSQSLFYRYKNDYAKQDMGNPDGGVAVPILEFLVPDGQDATVCADHIVDMRTAIEAVAPYCRNIETGNYFNWDNEDPDNLYFVAMGDRTKYGASGGAQYDWTRSLEEMKRTPTYDIDIGEVEETVMLLSIPRWGSSGSGDGKFSLPYGIAATTFNVYVADSANYRIQKFTTSGQFLRKWGSRGSGNGQFEWAYGVAANATGDVFVTDVGNHRVQKFDANGVYVLKWGTEGSGNGQFDHPYGIAATASAVYVADRGNSRIQKFDASGLYVRKWGSAGSGEGQFNWPCGVATDGSVVYVADSGNHRIQKFDTDGTFLLEWGSEGNGDGEFDHPFEVATDGSVVYVADTINHRIQKFDTNGVFLHKWGSEGSGSNEFDNPYGIAVDTIGRVYVVDRDNDRVQRFYGPSGFGPDPYGRNGGCT